MYNLCLLRDWGLEIRFIIWIADVQSLSPKRLGIGDWGFESAMYNLLARSHIGRGLEMRLSAWGRTVIVVSGVLSRLSALKLEMTDRSVQWLEQCLTEPTKDDCDQGMTYSLETLGPSVDQQYALPTTRHLCRLHMRNVLLHIGMVGIGIGDSNCLCAIS